MKKIKKIIYILIVGVFALEALLSNFAFAQTNNTTEVEEENCYVCGMPSLEFQTYVNFQVEVLQILQQASSNLEKTSNNRKVWLFSAGILWLPSRLWESWKSMFKKATKDLTDSTRAVKIWSIMLWTITTELVGKDSLWWLLILTRNAPFVREWKTLQELDMSIHDVMRDFWMKWLWDKEISQDTREKLMLLQQKYVSNSGNEKALFKTFSLDGNIKYKHMVNMSLTINSVMKSFVFTRSKMVGIELFETDLYRFKKEIRKHNITMEFNNLLMSNMFYNYKCAEWLNACNESWANFKKSMKIIPTIKDSFAESKKIMNQANKDFNEAYLSVKTSLKNSFNKNARKEKLPEGLNLTEKQITLLRTVYGIDTSKLTKQQWVWLSSLFNKTAWKNIVNSISIKPLDKNSASTISAMKKSHKKNKQNRQDQIYLNSIADKNTKEAEAKILSDIKEYGAWNIQKTLSLTIDSIMDQKQEDQLMFILYDNLSSTRYFFEIWSLIHQIMDETIWTKDSDWLIKYLWFACESACSNRWNVNCYAK